MNSLLPPPLLKRLFRFQGSAEALNSKEYQAFYRHPSTYLSRRSGRATIREYKRNFVSWIRRRNFANFRECFVKILKILILKKLKIRTFFFLFKKKESFHARYALDFYFFLFFFFHSFFIYLLVSFIAEKAFKPLLELARSWKVFKRAEIKRSSMSLDWANRHPNNVKT